MTKKCLLRIRWKQHIIKFLDERTYSIFCADMKGKDISKLNIKGKWAIILGSEAHGISKDFNQLNKVTIRQKGEIESLNVSVAAGIILESFVNK